MTTVMELVSNAIRGVIVAPAGKKLVVADLSNIEGRMLAWLAGENWKLQAFRDFDQGTGHDLYKLAYAKAFGVDAGSVDKEQRQVGKVMELALGYQGGVGAFLTFAAAYSIDLEAMGAKAIDGIPPATLADARDFLAWQREKKGGSQHGLTDTAWLVCESFKRLWRDAHPAISSWWSELEQACVRAVRMPGETIACRRHKIRRDGSWLRVSLPSGRCLCYPLPKVDEDGKLSYMGIDQFTKKWQRLSTYGGKLAENLTQGAARDVLAHGMTLAEQSGYAVVLSIHDELLCEVPNTGDFTVSGLSALMATPPEWAEGLPLAAAGFEGLRYRKE